MIILGLVLVGLAVLATVGMVIGGGQQTAIEIGGLRVETTTSGFFLFGFGLAIAVVCGVQLVVVGFKHWRRRRQELETLRSQVQPTSAPATQPEPAAAAGSTGSEPAAEVEPSRGATNEPPAIEGRRAAAGDPAVEPEPGRAATAPSVVRTTPAVPDEDQR